ncbi:MAG TPA: hypothetical protein VEZ44_10585, partial [bacterium]|nr:hypothetical protein [bacterium]
AVFVGVILRGIWTYWVGEHAAPGNLLIGAVVVATAVDGESNLSLMVGGVIHALVVYWVITVIAERWGRRRDRRSVARTGRT